MVSTYYRCIARIYCLWPQPIGRTYTGSVSILDIYVFNIIFIHIYKWNERFYRSLILTCISRLQFEMTNAFIRINLFDEINFHWSIESYDKGNTKQSKSYDSLSRFPSIHSSSDFLDIFITSNSQWIDNQNIYFLPHFSIVNIDLLYTFL